MLQSIDSSDLPSVDGETQQVPQSDQSAADSSSGQQSSRVPDLPPVTRLRFTSFEEGESFARPQHKFSIKNDDKDDVVDNRTTEFVLLLSNALITQGYACPPTFTTKKQDTGSNAITAQEIEKWHNWNKRAEKKLPQYYKRADIHKRAEGWAWKIFEDVIEVHETGFRVSPINDVTDLICSDRLHKIVEILKGYPLIRAEILGGDCKVAELAGHPENFRDRKFQHLWTNNRRDEKAKQVREKVKKADEILAKNREAMVQNEPPSTVDEQDLGDFMQDKSGVPDSDDTTLTQAADVQNDDQKRTKKPRKQYAQGEYAKANATARRHFAPTELEEKRNAETEKKKKTATVKKQQTANNNQQVVKSKRSKSKTGTDKADDAILADPSLTGTKRGTSEALDSAASPAPKKRARRARPKKETATNRGDDSPALVLE